MLGVRTEKYACIVFAEDTRYKNYWGHTFQRTGPQYSFIKFIRLYGPCGYQMRLTDLVSLRPYQDTIINERFM